MPVSNSLFFQTGQTKRYMEIPTRFAVLFLTNLTRTTTILLCTLFMATTRFSITFPRRSTTGTWIPSTTTGKMTCWGWWKRDVPLGKTSSSSTSTTKRPVSWQSPTSTRVLKILLQLLRIQTISSRLSPSSMRIVLQFIQVNLKRLTVVLW